MPFKNWKYAHCFDWLTSLDVQNMTLFWKKYQHNQMIYTRQSNRVNMVQHYDSDICMSWSNIFTLTATIIFYVFSLWSLSFLKTNPLEKNCRQTNKQTLSQLETSLQVCFSVYHNARHCTWSICCLSVDPVFVTYTCEDWWTFCKKLSFDLILLFYFIEFFLIIQ